ncbi:MAG: hypothetical protein VB109_23415 [Desulfitobacterium hafniense]|nr:hypothetical protein [Desulfitobacterium hafniense]MEA5025779.1 hypothetical protein [Desulfitobacterium hafniense]
MVSRHQEELDWQEDFELYDGRFLGYDHPESEIICISRSDNLQNPDNVLL